MNQDLNAQYGPAGSIRALQKLAEAKLVRKADSTTSTDESRVPAQQGAGRG